MDAVNELNLIARFASLNNIISTDQEGIISRTVGLSNKKARDIMVPASEMNYLSSDMNLMEALVEAHIHHHTRFPLVNAGNIDDVAGYVNLKDIVSALQINPADPSLKGIARPIVTVYENETFPVFFKKLLTGHQHIVIVKNEKGRVAGIITLEDIIEEIVGEIEDEYDVLPAYCYPIAVNRYISGGGITIKTINEKMDVELPHPNLNVHTWLITMFERLPKSGEKFIHGTIIFMVKKIRRSRVYEVIVEKNV
jgi:putative hemolysin